MYDTSKSAVVVAYVDEDQSDLYDSNRKDHNGSITNGPRVGSVASVNVLAKEVYADVYGFMADDMVITTPGWDEWVLDRVTRFPGEIGVIAPPYSVAGEYGHSVDIPFVTRGWVETLGWYAYPAMKHWCWPTVTGAIGVALDCIARPARSEFMIEHEHLEPMNLDAFRDDLRQLYAFFDHGRFESAVNHMRRSVLERSGVVPVSG